MRRIFFYGFHGSGKSIFAGMVDPSVVLSFGRIAETSIRRTDKYPQEWGACQMTPENLLMYPEALTSQGAYLRRDPAQREAYRNLLGIGPEEKVCHIVGECFFEATLGWEHPQRVDYLRGILDSLEEDFDVAICAFMPFTHETLPDTTDEIVAFSTSFEVLKKRASSLCWESRPTPDPETHADLVRYLVLTKGLFWPAIGHKALALWWQGDADQGRWVPIQEMIAERIADLAPWYQYHELGGVPTGFIHGLNGPRRWGLIQAHLPADMRGMRFIDIGSNSGYNSFEAALLGAEVLAVESSPLQVAQYQLARAWSTRLHTEAAARVQLHQGLIQQVPLGDRHFHFALLSCVHYHINRSGVAPYRAPGRQLHEHLRPPLAVVLEDLFASTNTIIIVTNEAHLNREVDPYPEAHRDWVADTLRTFGAARVSVYPGDAPERPILVAQVRP